jgi:hypothetical protein
MEEVTTYESLVTPVSKVKKPHYIIAIIIACLILYISVTIISNDYSDFSGFSKVKEMGNDVKVPLAILTLMTLIMYGTLRN